MNRRLPLLLCLSACSDRSAVPVEVFSLLDHNPTSPSHGAEVSPRDHLQKVSGWYFTNAT